MIDHSGNHLWPIARIHLFITHNHKLGVHKLT
ncbi:Uncharacterised protein [Vibrio cholerae]|nr:Uncharacterised protein [Vibrio cholerae]